MDPAEGGGARPRTKRSSPRRGEQASFFARIERPFLTKKLCGIMELAD